FWVICKADILKVGDIRKVDVGAVGVRGGMEGRRFGGLGAGQFWRRVWSGVSGHRHGYLAGQRWMLFFSVYYKPDEADQRRSFTSGDRSTSTTSPRPGEESSTNCPSSMDYLFNEW
ncbi:hypothetical protein T310_5856, partial [Rasamsonia emersonii CBS 393.64]